MLKTNILSVGQLDELGYEILICSCLMCIKDAERCVLSKILRGENRLYVLNATVAQPVCVLVCGDDVAWRWHARLGHLRFQALKKLSSHGWVRGMPKVDHVDQLCDGCLAGKHRSSLFLEKVVFHEEQHLDLVHGDLCGPHQAHYTGQQEIVHVAGRQFQQIHVAGVAAIQG
jgi:hypothetical protein